VIKGKGNNKLELMCVIKLKSESVVCD